MKAHPLRRSQASAAAGITGCSKWLCTYHQSFGESWLIKISRGIVCHSAAFGRRRRVAHRQAGISCTSHPRVQTRNASARASEISRFSAMPGCLLPAARPAPAATPHPLPAAAPQRPASSRRMQTSNELHRQSRGRRRVPVTEAAAAGGGSSGATEADPPASSTPAEAAAPAKQPGRQRQRNSHHPALEAINDATKWAVSAAAFGTLLWRRDLLSAFCVLGSIVAAINCRVSVQSIGMQLYVLHRCPGGSTPCMHVPALHGTCPVACVAGRLGAAWRRCGTFALQVRQRLPAVHPPGGCQQTAANLCTLGFCHLQVLKFAINQARPSERKADPGMPSAHANSLAFLVRIQLGGWGDGFWCSLWPIPALHRHSA